MAKQRINPSVGEIQGKIGDLVFYTRKGKPCVRRAPRRRKPATTAEKKNQGQFGQASKFASAALEDPVARARYERAAEVTGASAYNIAVRDYYETPVLAEIDLSQYTGRSGELISLTVRDGVIEAAQVQVKIADMANTVLEKGSAVKGPDSFTWGYTAQQDLAPNLALSITITARDQAGNRTQKTLRHTTGPL
ncbi:MAG: hypothetical protein AB9869_37780 [Verrucomicrobiia bacterium]